jgi:Kef-type K+ transport system membrane component KefB
MHSNLPIPLIIQIVATITLGLVAQLISQQEQFLAFANTKFGFTRASCCSYLHDIGNDLNMLWNMALRPLLFGSIGAAFDLRMLSRDTIWKACVVVIVCVVFRMITAYFAVRGQNLTKEERKFVAFCWIPKATVQAALCTLPLALVESKLDTSSSSYEQNVVWAEQIMATAIIAILITAPLGLVSIQYLGPRLLSREQHEPSKSPTREGEISNDQLSPVSA